MTCSHKNPFLALMALTVVAHLGCEPAAQKEPKVANRSGTELSESTNEEFASASTDGVTESDEDTIFLSGDLTEVDWPTMIGRKVAVTGELVVVDTYDLVRRGQLKVARDRLHIPTSRIDPNDSDPDGTTYEGGSNVAKVVKAQKHNDEATIILDDGSADENTFPPTLFPNLGKTHSTVRIGSVLNGVTGTLAKVRNKIVLVPDGPLQWTPAERPGRPDLGEARLTVASFNVLNYFTTLDDGRNGARGADTESEFRRQEAKLVSAIIALQADVVGLMELENNPDSEIQLVAALNRKIGKDVFKGCGLPDGFDQAPGGQNAIRVGIIYRSDRVEPEGKVSMIIDDAFDSARTPIVQSFRSASEVQPFTVVVNHFKSKGGSDGSDAANKNKGDGQGGHNATRRSQALALCKYIDGLKRESSEPRVLVIGDLNAYGQEDPIDALRSYGLVDLQERLEQKSSTKTPSEHYSFIYYGQSGSLDHAMATESLANDVTGTATWHINADEPRFQDYNEEHNPKTLFKADPFRSSDHDPVLIGIGN